MSTGGQLCTVLIFAWVWVDQVLAQTRTDEPALKLDPVTVTGSRLSRTDAETPSPVQIITQEEIARSGAVSLTEVMQKLPANNFGASNENDAARTHGAGGVSLRGLGAGATLVLINGRRVAPFGFAAAFGGISVDLNQIPIGMVERVEVLLDGASAVYGSDAVAGVVNIILRRSYRGAEVAAGYGRSTHGDATQRQASVMLGFGDLSTDGYNVFAGLSHLDQDPVKTPARWHSQSVDFRGFGLADFRSTYSYPGNLYTADNRTFLQALPGCTTAIGEPGSPGPGQCLSQPVRDLVAESKRDALFVASTAALPGGFELFGDAMIGHTVVRAQNLNFPGSSYSATGTSPVGLFLLPVGHPQNPYPFEVALRTRFLDELRVYTPTSDTQRVVAGARHHDLSGWDVEGALLWSHSKTSATTMGVIDDAVLHSEVFDASGRAVPGFRFGDPGANDPALMARLYPRLVDIGSTSTASVDLRGTREIFRLPGGAAQLAIGGEVRRERFSTAVDPRIASGEVSVLPGDTAVGSRTITSGYAELSLPITRMLEASLAGRYDRYSDFGGTTNSKAGMKWQLIPGIAVRGTFATAFQAPSPLETGSAPGHFFAPNVRDPKTCPVPDVANPNCDQRVRVDFSSNSALRPERANITTAGIVVEPWREASFTVDAFRIRRKDQIGAGDTTYLLAHEGEFPGSVVRNADGTLNRINVTTLNIGAVRAWGIDATVKTRAQLGELGQLGIDGSYAWLPHNWVATTPDAPLADYAGTWMQPKSRARLSFSLDRGPWRSALTFNYTGKYLRAISPLGLTCPYDAAGTNRPELCSVKAWRTTDLFIGYTGFQRLELGLLITNIDNVQAPFDANQVPGNFSAYQSAFHSAVGRFFKLTAKYSFQ